MEDFEEVSRMGLEGEELNLNCPRKYQNLLKSNILIANLSCIDASPCVEVGACAIPLIDGLSSKWNLARRQTKIRRKRTSA